MASNTVSNVQFLEAVALSSGGDGVVISLPVAVHASFLFFDPPNLLALFSSSFKLWGYHYI